MTSDADAINPGKGDGRKAATESDLDGQLTRLEKDYRELTETAQQLLTERVYLENEVSQQKKKVSRLEEEVRLLKSPPHIIGHIQDVIDDDRMVVRSSNGTVFLVANNRRLDPENLGPGTRVALNQDSLAVVDVLHDSWDPLVSGAEMLDKPGITYSDLGGLEEQILLVKESVELPLQEPESFTNFGIDPPNGVLLIGPPGCGKTMLAKAVASSTECTFIRMVASELAQKYIGEGGRMVRELFDLAREKSPAIVFIDEIDAIGAKRLDTATSGDREVQRTLMQLLAELDGFDALDDVKLIAATNRPDILDEALLRPGRFDRIIEIPLPNEKAREAILKIHAHKMPLQRGLSIKDIVAQTRDFTGAELKATCVEAAMIAIRAGSKKVSAQNFKKAIQRVKDKKANAIGDAPSGIYG
uniref:Proteasome endopeptidase complex subunit (PsmR) n=1 Tax=uncultured marine group II/III euryarchaeote KM3_28_D12 TaxID=1456431 RepID=A0A075H1B2_9EURY|nr:proteasome endopeptidase complex subunit (psmR) [uncultured marine group II/III euryarchaeote KM3_28_D12]